MDKNIFIFTAFVIIALLALFVVSCDDDKEDANSDDAIQQTPTQTLPPSDGTECTGEGCDDDVKESIEDPIEPTEGTS